MNTRSSTQYVTAALPYVNAEPHLGHAFGLVLADAISRHQRARGTDLRFATGSDENSLKSVQTAELAGVPTEELVAHNAERFSELGRALEIGCDDFVRTSTDLGHRAAVAALWQACAKSGDLYRSTYRGLYCVGCEDFYRERELDEGVCPEHGVAPEPVEEANWFFRLSRYAPALRRSIGCGEISVVPEERRNEVLAFIDGGLEDFSVSRSRVRARGWGIAVPDDPDQIVFVWFDALAGYLSALGWPSDSAPFRKYWRDSAERVHVIGKGISRFHAVYWPAILLSAGLSPPTRIQVHGYLTVTGRKIGKSLGNGVDPFALIDDVGAPALRHYLLRHVSTTKDADFSVERLREARTTDLAHQLGNLVQRSLRLVERAGGRLPRAGALGEAEHELADALASARDGVGEGFARFDLRAAADAAWSFVAASNRYVDRTAPWQLEPGSERSNTVLHQLGFALREISTLLAPFLPSTAREIAARLQAPTLCAGAPLFPRLDR